MNRRRVLSVPLLLLAAVALPTPAVEPFGPGPTGFLTGIRTTSLVTGDINNDGVVDLLITSRGVDSLTIAVGDGVGGFATSTLTVGAAPQDVAPGDFNGDGHIDLAVLHLLDRNVVLYTGDGRGAFTPTVSVPVGSNARRLIAGRWRDAGQLDLAVATRDDGNVQILRNDGTGGLLPGEFLMLGGEPEDLVAVDLDGNGMQDLLVLDRRLNRVQPFLSDGSGIFVTASSTSLMAGATSIAVDDLDGDGRVDLVVGIDGLFEEDGIVLYSGDGDGGFRLESDGLIPTGWGPPGLALADIDVDGDPDILVANRNDRTISRFLNDGGFALTSLTPLFGGGAMLSIVSADFTGDGIADVATRLETERGSSAPVRVLRGTGAAGFETQTEGFNVEGGVGYLATADFNRDGLTDLITGETRDQFNNQIGGVYLADGLGGFIGPVSNQRADRCRPVADFDLDGIPDTVDFGNQTAVVSFGDGAGGVARTTTVDVMTPGFFFNCAVAGDADGDGVPDLTLPTLFGPLIFGVYVGDGKGSFEFREDLGAQTNLLGNVQSLTPGDFNGDSLTDLAIVQNYGEVLMWVAPNRFVRIPTSTSAFFSKVGDLNADGVDDLVISPDVESAIELMMGFDGNTFREIVVLPVSEKDGQVAIEDLNQDGFVDMAIAFPNTSTMDLMFGDSAGGFERVAELTTGAEPIDIAVADFDADGLPDLAVAARLEDRVSLLFNQLGQRADTNGSNRIDGFDTNAVGLSWAKQRDEPDYRANLDVDLDGTIGGSDLCLIAERMGEFVRSVSPLQPSIEVMAAADPDTVTLQLPEGAVENDEFTIDVVVHETDDGVAGASFALMFEPDDDPTQLLRFLGIAGGSYLTQGEGIQVLTTDDSAPGRVEITASRVPADTAIVGTAADTLVSLRFRARRAGETSLEFGDAQLIDGSGNAIPGTSFIGGPTVTVGSSSEGLAGERIGVSPTEIAFGATEVGSLLRRKLRITNLGFSELSVTDIRAGAPEFTTFFSGAFTVSPFTYVELTVKFTPSAPGAFTSDLVIENNDREIRVLLQGNGH